MNTLDMACGIDVKYVVVLPEASILQVLVITRRSIRSTCFYCMKRTTFEKHTFLLLDTLLNRFDLFDDNGAFEPVAVAPH
jgi:hypothetical protein